ncbi:hypothetical protein GGR56DRAFT_618008 [Xylariaceae sp. FL0804]|nr:hypothetical protein GGR56DRAFT_618008 [Xylariaceae sp. FL0804]
MSQMDSRPDTRRGQIPPLRTQPPSNRRSVAPNGSSNDSQATAASSNDTDRVFTPPESDSEGSSRQADGANSSQESQLMQLSQLAAAQQKMTGVGEGDAADGPSRKRTADGAVKHVRQSSSTSPVRRGHARNASAVSVASTTGSRIGELSAELKAKLSYAMVKVNKGWQSHSIDEVESLASQAASPTSSTSTLHGSHGASASPRMRITAPRYTASNPSSTATSPAVQQPPSGRTYESFWKESNVRAPISTSPTTRTPALAPPAPIQPRQAGQSNPRRNSTARYTPAYLSHSHNASPHTPAQPSPLQSTPGQRGIRTPNVDPILFSPHQNVREQEALETLLFMSSPGNSANMKHTFPPSQTSQATSQASRTGTRTALPTSRLNPGNEGSSQPRKSLPTSRLQPQQPKRVEFEKSPSTYSEMEVDDQYGSPQTRGTPRRRTLNGSAPRPALSLPAGLSRPSRPRPRLGDDDIQQMIDRMAADDSSDSEGEIQLPPRRSGAGVGI